MIDTICIKIKAEGHSKDNWDHLIDLTSRKSTQQEDGRVSHIGWYKNFRVIINDDEVVIQGSLTKYAVGDNLRTADREQLEEAVRELSERTKMDLYQGVVCRLDLAANLLMKHPPTVYSQFLLELPLLKRIQVLDGVLFKNTQREVVFYDKIKEMKNDSYAIVEEELSGKNILRLEYRFKNKTAVSRMMRLKNPTVKQVLDNYNSLVLAWVDIYKKIYKKTDILQFQKGMLPTPKFLREYLMIKGIESEGGAGAILEMINLSKAMGYLNHHPMVATNLKTSIKDLMNKPMPILRHSQLIQELEKKVEIVGYHALDLNMVSKC